MLTSQQDELDTDLQLGSPGLARIVFRGRLNVRTVIPSWKQLEQRLRGVKLEKLEVDASGLLVEDGAGMSLLRYLNMGRMTPGAAVSLHGLDEKSEAFFHRFTLEDYNAFRPAEEKCHSLPEEVGSGVRKLAGDFREQVEFLGSVSRNFLPTLMDRKQTRWLEVRRIFELAGANAMPIVSLISILVGLIIAFESVQPLEEFGAQIYVVNMIGLIMVRELGPLLTAVLLAGRSSSAFAAEIGTMKVNEELDALHTFGLDPIRFLVIQRIIGGVILAPLLTLYSMCLGILGGALVARTMGFPWSLILHQLSSSVDVSDVLFGLTKGVVFGAIISGVGCLRGMQTRQGPSAVGISTTRAVVTSIVLVIMADAVFSVLFYILNP
jgi:phospholipid/cholesterol/gamma-HCH transport system permease protein